MFKGKGGKGGSDKKALPVAAAQTNVKLDPKGAGASKSKGNKKKCCD